MTGKSTGFEIQHSGDFGQVYNLDDPAPYYAHLDACDYQMPAHVTEWIVANEATIRAERNIEPGEPVRVLDLACGFGFNGALLQHRLTLADVYDHYAARPWSPELGRANWTSDAVRFASVRRPDSSVELSGIDIAPVAIEYAVACGLITSGFVDDLVVGPPSPALFDHLRTIDVVIESGAIGSIYVDCFGQILEAVESTRNRTARPWFVYCPRPNVDRRPIDALWSHRGYTHATCSAPLRYRQPIGDLETQMVLDETVSAGNDPATALVDGYLAVEMRLARPGPGRVDEDRPASSRSLLRAP